MRQGRRRTAVAATLAVSAAVAGSVMTPSGVQADTPVGEGQLLPAVEASPTGRYIVVVNDDPLLVEFSQDQLRSDNAKRKGRDIARGHDELIAHAGVQVDKTASYVNALNGFAVQASPAEIERIAAEPGVRTVLPDLLYQPDTDVSQEFLGLNDAGGAYASGLDGEGVVIGVIDSGIWPEHPSLADDGTYAAPPVSIDPVDLDGVVYDGCDFGDTEHALAAGLEDAPFTCNNKLIGARHVMPAYLDSPGLTQVEYASARDEDGHGTHTATTAAGNADVQAEIFGNDFGLVTGIAPRAHVVAYKALGIDGGYGSDLALAIDLAVADGVDVINYSIGSSSPAIGPDDIAFLFAAGAGVHVATSAGNSGPGAATLGSPSSVPWLTTVGASTHTRTYRGTMTLGDGTVLEGASITESTDMVPLVDAVDLGNELCLPDAWAAGTDLTGQIVLCRRGQNARVEKSLAAAQVNAAGMILYNASPTETLTADPHYLAAIHITADDGAVVKNYLAATEAPVAQINGWEQVERPGSVMADFSSRGENLLSADILKPDVTAPGVDILAGNTPTPTLGRPGQYFQAISGTSMSSPHVAGLMALIDQAHPDWSPAAVKSALMTTARQDVLKEDGSTPADPFDMGAGHVDPAGPVAAEGSIFNPGIVFDNDIYGAVAYTCGEGFELFTRATCDSIVGAGYPTDASDYNQASIAIGELAGTQTVTRTMTNVAGRALNLTASFEAPDGFEVSISPSKVTVPVGRTATFEITVTAVDPQPKQWAFGSMTLTETSKGKGKQHSARVPIAVRAVAVAAPLEIGPVPIADGGVSFDVQFGYNGAYQALGHGLSEALPLDPDTPLSVAQDPDQTWEFNDLFAPWGDYRIIETDGSALVRITVPPIEASPDADIDVFVYEFVGGNTIAEIASSTNGGTDELVDLLLPADNAYLIAVHGWLVPGGGPIDVPVYVADVPLATDGNLEVSSTDTAVLGGTATVDASWPTDLAGDDYLGVVSHGPVDERTDFTIVEVGG